MHPHRRARQYNAKSAICPTKVSLIRVFRQARVRIPVKSSGSAGIMLAEETPMILDIAAGVLLAVMVINFFNGIESALRRGGWMEEP